VELASKSTKVGPKALIGTFVEDVTRARSRERHWNLTEAPVRTRGGVHPKKERRSDTTTHGALRKKGGGRGWGYIAWRRDELGGEKTRVGATGFCVTVQDELEVDFRLRVKSGPMVEAEAPRILAVELRVSVHATVGVDVPHLDVFVAKEVERRFRATRDTPYETRRFASIAVVDDVLRRNVERHVAC
jgi:hypothetical protein